MCNTLNENMKRLQVAVETGDTLAGILAIRVLGPAGFLEEEINNVGETPLAYAVRNQGETSDLTLIEALLDAGACPNVWDSNVDTPLIAAFGYSNMDLASLLVKHGANVNLSDEETGWSAWDVAKNTGNAKMLSFLRQNAAKKVQGVV